MSVQGNGGIIILNRNIALEGTVLDPIILDASFSEHASLQVVCTGNATAAVRLYGTAFPLRTEQYIDDLADVWQDVTPTDTPTNVATGSPFFSMVDSRCARYKLVLTLGGTSGKVYVAYTTKG